MDGTEERRQLAVEDARRALETKGARPGRPSAAQIMWPVACAKRELQIKYIAVHGSEERTRNNLAEEPGTELNAEAAERVNFSASCLAAAELFLKPPVSLANVQPPAPDVGALRAIRERSRKEIDSAAGSAAGKALVVDFLRYLYAGASSGSTPQRFLDKTSQRLHEQCR